MRRYGGAGAKPFPTIYGGGITNSQLVPFHADEVAIF
jgi:hypothetical protein